MSIDSLNQVGPTVVLPEHLQQAIEHARNNVTLLDAEATRLQKLAHDAKNIVEAKHSEQATIGAQIDTLTNRVNELVELASKRSLEVQALDTKLAITSQNLTETQLKAEALVKEGTIRSAQLDIREARIKDTEEELNSRSIELLHKEGQHSAKVEKLKKALE